jgi:hypothetical protein
MAVVDIRLVLAPQSGLQRSQDFGRGLRSLIVETAFDEAFEDSASAGDFAPP